MKLTHFSLFTGIGGIDLAAEWAGFETVGQCEWADYPTKILEKHWPNVPRWRDIRSVTKESFTSTTGLHTVDLISGGFPCQPFSVAGKQRGKNDDRYLWPEMLRIIGEIKPTWVIGENVENAVRMVLDDIINGLEGIGYTVQPYVVSAYCSGAWFDGKRTFIAASSNDRCAAMRGNTQLQPNDKTMQVGGNYRGRAQGVNLWGRATSEPRPFGVDNGIPNRVDRLKCLGNAVVPQQIYPILQAIADIHKGGKS